MKLLIIILFLSSCAIMPKRSAKRDVNTPRSFKELRYGMKIESVRKGLGSPRGIEFKNGRLVHTYLTGRNMFTMGRYYKLSFENNILTGWEIKEIPNTRMNYGFKPAFSKPKEREPAPQRQTVCRQRGNNIVCTEQPDGVYQ